MNRALVRSQTAEKSEIATFEFQKLVVCPGQMPITGGARKSVGRETNGGRWSFQPRHLE